MSKSSVDPVIWSAASGAFIQLPRVGDRVYYFPQGHFEQCPSPPPPSAAPPPPFFLCRVLDLTFMAHSNTDQPFAKLRLLPISNHSPAAAAYLSKYGGYDTRYVADVTICGHSGADNAAAGGGGGYKRKEGGGGVADVSSGDEKADVVSFTKILTPSDANNGGGFSVPRFCADSIFPPLDFESDPPVQNLVMRDIHGASFAFRHIYRGTPRRHLLTTGWSKFVNSKKLVAGDSVVFMRKRQTGALYLGVRRSLRGGGDVSPAWNGLVGSVKSKEDDWTVARGVSVDFVLQGLEKAVRGMEFEVVFYPRVGWSEFIVKEESVEKAMEMIWVSGMRVKMAMETEDSTRTTWHTGIVSSATLPDRGPWRGSPWRMLEVHLQILLSCNS